MILADHPLEEIFVQNGDHHSHDESHILMDDLGLKRVRVNLTLTDSHKKCHLSLEKEGRGWWNTEAQVHCWKEH